MSPEEIREVLGRVEHQIVDEIEDWDHYMEVDKPLAEAARAYALLLENGAESFWCEQHDTSSPVAENCRYRGQHVNRCQMVSVLVVRVGESP